MRITGGQLARLIVASPKGLKVRPTQDRVREALFSMLADTIVGATFADLYAGSGVVGLEALSRGASRVIWVEDDRAVARVTRANAERIAGAGKNVVVGEALAWMRRAGADAAFDMVFADPPYWETRADEMREIAVAAVQHNVVRPGGLLIAEMPLRSETPVWPGWVQLRDRAYGRTRLVICQRIEND